MNRRLALSVALLLVLLAAGWYLLLWKPEASHLKAARSADAQALAARGPLLSQLAGLRTLQQNLSKDERALQVSLPALPVAASVDTVIDQIDAAAKSSGVNWKNESQALGTSTATAGTAVTTPTTATTGGATTAPAATGASTLALTLDVDGGYSNVTAFITLLEHRPRLIVIDGLSFSPQSSTTADGPTGAIGSADVSVAITARAFYDPASVPNLSKLVTKMKT